MDFESFDDFRMAYSRSFAAERAALIRLPPCPVCKLAPVMNYGASWCVHCRQGFAANNHAAVPVMVEVFHDSSSGVPMAIFVRGLRGSPAFGFGFSFGLFWDPCPLPLDFRDMNE